MSTEDWAWGATRYIMAEFSLGTAANRVKAEKIASIISAHAAPLVALLRESKRVGHGTDDEGDPCEKVNYLDGLHACTCGMETWNARVDAVLAGDGIREIAKENGPK